MSNGRWSAPEDDYEDALARSTERRPFANGTEGDLWMDGWCRREPNGCVRVDSCTVLDVAVIEERTPAEWVSGRPVLGREMYRCTRFEAAR